MRSSVLGNKVNLWFTSQGLSLVPVITGNRGGVGRPLWNQEFTIWNCLCQVFLQGENNIQQFAAYAYHICTHFGSIFFKKKRNCWKKISYPFKSKNRESQLHTNITDCADEIHGWAERAVSGKENLTSEQKRLRT